VTGSPKNRRSATHLAAAALLTGLLLFAAFATMVLHSRADLSAEIHRKIVERDAAVLHRVARQQLAEGASTAGAAPLATLLRSVRQEGMLAIATFDTDGTTLDAVPADQLFVELPMEDYVRLQTGEHISRYHPAFPLDEYFAGVAANQPPAPVLEVLLSLGSSPEGRRLGFVRYYIDARPLARELAVLDARVARQTAILLGLGASVVALVMAGAAYGLNRARRAIDERNERLTRALFELTLAAKASALGQVTSHLIHGLQGPVAGLRAAVAGQETPDWETAAGYTERLQSMIQETIALLGDIGANASYELTGTELADTIRARNATAALQRSVVFEVTAHYTGQIDSHRGSLLCLIASNLVQNAFAATPAGRRVTVSLAAQGTSLELLVHDEGAGIPPEQQARLFEPGRSGRAGGSGLGLAISRLLARQIGAELTLVSTGPAGTIFRVTIPLAQ
jgi:signal transduction histidine kinase